MIRSEVLLRNLCGGDGLNRLLVVVNGILRSYNLHSHIPLGSALRLSGNVFEEKLICLYDHVFRRSCIGWLGVRFSDGVLTKL